MLDPHAMSADKPPLDIFAAWIARATDEEVEEALDMAHDAIVRRWPGDEQIQADAMKRTYVIFDAAKERARLAALH